MSRILPRVLLVLQTRDASAGRCERKLREHGYLLDYCYPQTGDSLPKEVDCYAGIVVFGGPMSANDEDKLPGIRAQMNWIPQALAANRPFLGICLGAQLLARALGATVQPHPAGWAEIGYFPVYPTAAGQTWFDRPLQVYHWHREGFALPEGAELLATGTCFPHQAYRYGHHAFGLQFHPEVDQAILNTWLVQGAQELTALGAQPAAEQRACSARHDVIMDRWFDAFLTRWLQKEQSSVFSCRDLLSLP